MLAAGGINLPYFNQLYQSGQDPFRNSLGRDNGVTIEELHDDEIIDYANMPPLVNVRSPLFLSHTEPPFIYQYVGDQVKIIQVLGNYPLTDRTDLDYRDQKQNQEIGNKEIIYSEAVSDKSELKPDINSKNIPKDITNIPPHNQSKCITDVYDQSNNLVSNENSDTQSQSEVDIKENTDEVCSLDVNNSYSAESDDEASFGTPDNSPKSNRKLNKGKYGKSKAPLPPLQTDKDVLKSQRLGGLENLFDKSKLLSSEESVLDASKTTSTNQIQDDEICKESDSNTSTEEKSSQRSNSKNKTNKVNATGLGKLLQIPGKLVFWHREDKTKSDETSSYSEDKSRRSSSTFDEFQNCGDIDFNLESNENGVVQFQTCEEDQISYKDADDFETQSLTQKQDVLAKSEALQKVIEATLENHPEYKLSLSHKEIPTTSKSTDV